MKRLIRIGLLALVIILAMQMWWTTPLTPVPAQAPPVSTAEPTFRPRRLLEAQPTITNAPMFQASTVDGDLNPSELVLGVEVNGDARAYPINMLTGPRREIINDRVGGQRLAATW